MLSAHFADEQVETKEDGVSSPKFQTVVKGKDYACSGCPEYRAGTAINRQRFGVSSLWLLGWI